MENQSTPSRQQISNNFALAKFLSIVLVSTGHYFDGSLLWVPVTIGLFIFAFASGYFTSLKHSTDIPLKDFWFAKLRRLGPPLIVINLFLGILFLIQGREGILHPHTILGVTGLTGILNWLGIVNRSPYGNGLWFMTVLLLFYLIYPILAKFLSSRRASVIFLTSSAAICMIGHIFATPAYMLWPTVFGFCFGAVAGRNNWKLSKRLALGLGAGAAIMMLIASAVGIKQFNTLLIVLAAIACIAYLLSTPIPTSDYPTLFGCIFEIYLIHGYMFIKTSHSALTGYIASMLIITSTAVVLHKIVLHFSISKPHLKKLTT